MILIGDCLEILPTLEAESVQCCVTSPPYYGLRDYGCSGQIGLESTPEAYVEKMVAVFREVRRVMRPDAVCFLNLGDSYWGGKGSNGSSKARRTADERGYLQSDGTVMMDTRPSDMVPNLSDALKGRFEGGIFFFGSPDPRGCSAESVDILIYDKRSPDSIFKPFFTAKRVSIKNGQDDFCEVGNLFHSPVKCFIGESLRLTLPTDTAEGFVNIPDNIGVIITTGDLDTDAAIRGTVMLPVKNGKASLPVKIASEPISKGIPSAIPVFDTVSFNTGTETISKAQAINKPVSLLDSSEFGPGSLGHFAIRKASNQEAFFVLHNGAEVRCLSVRHLHLLSNNSLTPYCSILDKEVKRKNYYQAKQEIGIPFLVRQALMEDGWICRQTIIWAKPNPMPESVTDRCTKSHEYIFLLTKSARYFYDAEAVKEPFADERMGNPGKYKWKQGEGGVAGGGPNSLHKGDGIVEGWNQDGNNTGRNRRSVWTITTKPFKEAHFATFPPEIPEICIKAGTSEKGCCPECGKPWVRVVERKAENHISRQDRQTATGGAITGGVGKNFPDVELITTGWRPTCTHGLAPAPCVVLDPFSGANTTGLVAKKLSRRSIGIELSPAYAKMGEERIDKECGDIF